MCTYNNCSAAMVLLECGSIQCRVSLCYGYFSRLDKILSERSPWCCLSPSAVLLLLLLLLFLLLVLLGFSFFCCLRVIRTYGWTTQDVNVMADSGLL